MARKKAPRLSVIIPTQGRETLKRTLDSCVTAGLSKDDEILVIWDAFEMPSDFHYEWTSKPEWATFIGGALQAGHHCWGHCQLGYGITRARGDYIVLNDDDDVFTPGAFDRIRATISQLDEHVPLLYRFQSWWGNVYWETPGLAVENHIGGHCAVFPRDERLGKFSCRYQGDYDYIRSTLDNWGGDDMAVWVDDVIAVARPQEGPV
jgi:glycosyltransferase involved in cell wall biosynthesis